MSHSRRCPNWAEDSARPIIFFNDMEGFEYSPGGTCFLFSYEGRRYIATAKHCMDGRTGEDLQVHATLAFDDRSLPFSRQLVVAEGMNLPAYAKDVVVFRLDEGKATSAQRRACDAFDLNSWTPLVLQKDDPLLVVGFPSERREIDYDESWFKNQRVLAEGRYLEGSTERRLGWLALEVPEMKHPNGFSGSPVFALDWSGGKCAIRCFSGLLIRSSTDTQPWHMQYVCGSILKAIVHADQPA